MSDPWPRAIEDLHVQGTMDAGMVSGWCAHCDWRWPCPSAHIARWGVESGPCEEAGWCGHEGVPL
jgi:hypothetical protein